MAEQRSDKSPFQSQFGGGWVSASQFLAETMCDRKARLKGTALPQRFWRADVSAVWEREFLTQLRHANALLKLYGIKAVVRALRTPPGKKIFSLGAKHLDPLIREEQLKLDREAALIAQRKPPAETRPVRLEPPRPAPPGQASKLSKLRDL
jgi:hypothetical protein